MSSPTIPIHSDGLEATRWLERLPAYSRNLLRIEVPVTVTLATTKQPVGNIMELIPGTILQFEKMCDEPLGLEVGGQCVAEGETVKVGDKFGIRITSMVLPGERFAPVAGSSSRTDKSDDSCSTDPNTSPRGECESH